MLPPDAPPATAATGGQAGAAAAARAATTAPGAGRWRHRSPHGSGVQGGRGQHAADGPGQQPTAADARIETDPHTAGRTTPP